MQLRSFFVIYLVSKRKCYRPCNHGYSDKIVWHQLFCQNNESKIYWNSDEIPDFDNSNHINAATQQPRVNPGDDNKILRSQKMAASLL